MTLANLEIDVQVTEFLSSAYLKIFLNYLQLLSLIGNLDLKWTKSMSQIFDIGKIMTGSFLQVISFDCLFKGKLIQKISYT